MFTAVTARDTGRRAASRAAWLLGSTALQGGLVAAGVLLALAVRPPAAAEEPTLPTVVFKQPPRPAEPRPALPAGRPRADRPAPRDPALLQPAEIAPEASLDPGPVEALPFASGGGDADWVPGTAPPAPSGPAAVEDVVFAGAGFRAPAMAQRGCVQRSVRVPRDLTGYVSGTIVVKFAVGRDGSPGRFAVTSGGVPDRLAAAVWQAVQDCRWVPGADPTGQPTSIWVVMPLRFSGE